MSEKNKDIKNAQLIKLDPEGHQIVHEKLKEVARSFGQKVPDVGYAVVLEKPAVTRTPGWVAENAIVLTDLETKSSEQIEAEFTQQKLEAVEKLRSATVLEGDDACAQIYQFSSRIVESPIKTLKEERKRAEKKTIESLTNILVTLGGKIAAYKGAPEAARKNAVNSRRPLFGFPENPTQKSEIEKNVEEAIAAYGETFKKMEKAIPYLEEVKQVYEEVLAEKEKLNAEQQAKIPKTLKEMENLSKEAGKLYPKIQKLANEYQEDMKENSLERLAVIVEEYLDSQSRWMEYKRQLYGLDPQPQFSAMPDLPVLPRKLWKRIQES